MTALTWLAVALICLGGIGLAVAPYWSTPWPGVVLAGLSIFPLALEAWSGRNEDRSRGVIEALSRTATLEDKLAEAVRMASDAHKRIEATKDMMAGATVAAHAANERIGRMQDEINSLRNAASLRGTLGG